MKKHLLFIIICGIFLIGAPLMVQSQGEFIPDPLEGKTITEILKDITKALRIIAIPVAGIMLIISGFQYLTSTGNEEKANKAKKTMLYTIIGLAIIIAVDFIVGILKETLSSP